MQRFHRRVVLLSVVSVLILSLAGACALEPPRTAEHVSDEALEAGNGSVTYDQALVLCAAGETQATVKGAAGWQDLQAGDFVTQGQSLKTGPESSCELQFGDSAVVCVSENTELSLSELWLKPGAARIRAGVEKGTVLCKVEKLGEPERFQVRTQTAVCAVRGTEFGVTVSGEGDTVLAVKTGRVGFQPAALDPDQLAADIAGDDPALVETAAETAAELKKAEQVVAAEEEAEMTAADSRRAEETIRTLRSDLKRLAAKKKTGLEVRALFRTRLEQAAGDLRRGVRAPRRFGPERREVLRRIDELKRRRILVGPAAGPEETQAPPEGAPMRERPPARRAPVPGQSDKLVRIRLTVEPRAAVIVLDDRLAGRGVFQGLFPEGESLNVLLLLEGYVTKPDRIVVSRRGRKVFSYSLDRLPVPEPGRSADPTSQAELPPEAEGTEEEPADESAPAVHPIVATIPLPGIVAIAEMAPFEKRLYGADRAGTIFCLDADGRELARVKSAGNLNVRPFLAGGRMFLAGDKEIVILDARTGREEQRFPADKIRGLDYRRRLVAAPGIYGMPGDNGLDIMDAAGRKPPRHIPFPPGTDMSLLIYQGRLFATGRDGQIRVIDIADGRPVSGPPIASVRDPDAYVVWIKPLRLYITGSGRQLVCVDPETRLRMWEKRFYTQGLGAAQLAVSEAGVFVFAGGRITAFAHSEKGDQLFATEPGVSAPPLALRDSLVIGRTDNSVEILDARTGAVRKRLNLTSRITSRPVFTGKNIVVGTEDGKIIVLDPLASWDGQPSAAVESLPPDGRFPPPDRRRPRPRSRQPDDLAEDVSEDAPEDVAEDVSEELSEDVPEDAPPEKAPPRKPRKILPKKPDPRKKPIQPR